MRNLYEILIERARRFPEAIALGGQAGLTWKTLTSFQMKDAVDALAVELAERQGVREGDRVVLWLPNAPRTPIYFFALWKLGAVVVPFDREMNPEAAAAIIASTEPTRVIVGFGERPAWATGAPVVEWWEPGSLGEGEAARGEAGKRGSGEAVGEGSPSSSPPPHLPASPLAALFFTSGTTGAPKGCMISHANLLSQVEALPAKIPLDTDCRLASILPLSHLFELTGGLIYPLHQGAAIHYVPSRRGPEIVKVLHDQRITHMIAVPQALTLMANALYEQLRKQLPGPVYTALLALAERLPLAARRKLFTPVHSKIGGQLRLMGSGGAALSAETQRRWELIGVRIAQGFGASECSPIITCGDSRNGTPIGTCGTPLPGVEVRLSPEGEILVKGPNVMQGYWKDPVRTAEVLKDGWYYTGDLGSLDAAGNLTIAGRARDLLVLPSGMKVWPTDVEDVLRDQPGVKDAAVVLARQPGGGVTLHAYLLPAHEHTSLAPILAAANKRLAVHQRVATASWWPETDFPRTHTLKVKRQQLPAPSEAPSGAEVAGAVVDSDAVVAAIAGMAKVAAVRPEQTLGELGFDSLSLVELALAIESKTGVHLEDGELLAAMTVAQVREFVAARGGGDATAERAPAVNEGGVTPAWPYVGPGRALGALGLPFDLLFRYGVTRLLVGGGEHLRDLPADRVILAGTHHSFADFHAVRFALRQTPARRLADRMIIAGAAIMIAGAGALGWFAMLAFRLYPIKQHAGRAESLRRLAELAAMGCPVLIFPQGVHTHREDELAGNPAADFKTGVAHLAEALDGSVVPFGISGTERVVLATAEGHKGLVIAGVPVKITRGPIALVFGAPVRRGRDESANAFTDRLQVICFALTDESDALLAGHQATTDARPTA